MEHLRIDKLEEVRHIITAKCNLECLHCYLDAGGEKNKEEEPDIKVDALERFYTKYKPAIVSATGGEPLLKKELVKLLGKIINSYGGKLEIVTNGILIDEKFVEEMNAINPNTFYQISIDGDKKYHDYLRNKEGAYEEAMNAIKIIANKGIKLKVRLTATNENIMVIPKLIEYLDAFNNKNIDLVMRPIVTAGRAKENSLSFDSNYDLLDSFEAKNIDIRTTDNDGKCGCGVNTVAIDQNGKIYPCNYTIGNPKYEMGNLYNEESEIYEDEEFKEFTGKCYARHIKMFSI